MDVLSLFDGISCLQLALNKSGEVYNRYYASEIDKHAIKVVSRGYPNTINVGDITKHKDWAIDWSSINLVVAGFPCQSWSLAGQQLGDKDPRGELFWVMLEILVKVIHNNPEAKFIIENVVMKASFEDYITKHLEANLGEVFKTKINSGLVSAQNRVRCYWTNFAVPQPEDLCVKLSSIIQHSVIGKYYYKEGSVNYMERGNTKWAQAGSRRADRYTQDITDEKSYTITANYYKGVPYNYFLDGKGYRKLTPIECERLQTIPDNYTDCISDTQRYKALGNSFTVDVIRHILRYK